MSSSSLLVEVILAANPWLRTFFTNDFVLESERCTDSCNKLIYTRMIAIAEVLSLVSKSMDYNIAVDERYYTQLERFSLQRQTHIDNLCANSTFDALDPVVRFAILVSLAVVNEEHLNLTMTEILSQGFTQLCYRNGMMLDFDPLLVFKIFDYLPSHLDLLHESIKSIISRNLPFEKTLLKTFIADHPQASISIIRRMMCSDEIIVQSNVLNVLVGMVAACHSVPHPFDLIEERYIRNLNQLVLEHASLWKCFSPCTLHHFVQVVTAISMKRAQYLALERNTLRLLFSTMKIGSETELSQLRIFSERHGIMYGLLPTIISTTK